MLLMMKPKGFIITSSPGFHKSSTSQISTGMFVRLIMPESHLWLAMLRSQRHSFNSEQVITKHMSLSCAISLSSYRTSARPIVGHTSFVNLAPRIAQVAYKRFYVMMSSQVGVGTAATRPAVPFRRGSCRRPGFRTSLRRRSVVVSQASASLDSLDSGDQVILSFDGRQAVLSAMQELDFRATPAEVASRCGLSISETERLLQWLTYQTKGSMKVRCPQPNQGSS
jgi:hypothetical protein